MSTVAKNFLVEHRINALANVFLMGRNSISTYAMQNFGDVDLLARYLPEGDEQEKLFAVIVKGTPHALNSEQEASLFFNQWSKTKKRVQYLPFPVLMLAFSMVNDEGYYAWRLEPVFTRGEPLLKLNTNFKAHKATKKGLDAITEVINGWYLEQFRQFIE